MSLKHLITVWNEAVTLFDAGKYKEAIDKFDKITDPSSKIFFSIAGIHLLCDNYDEAIHWFTKAVEKDSYLAVAYFQRALVYFKLNRYRDAEEDLHLSLETFRGSDFIDYTQLGLQTKLYASQVLYNTAVVLRRQGRHDEARTYINHASQMPPKDPSRATAISEFTPLTNPLKCSVFRPPKSAVDNLQKKDYIGKAKVVSSLTADDNFVGFEGARKSHSNPTSPVPQRSKIRLGVDDVTFRKGSLTPPPPRKPPIRPRSNLPLSKNVTSNSTNRAEHSNLSPKLTGVSGSRPFGISGSRSYDDLTSRSGQGSQPPQNHPSPRLPRGQVQSSKPKPSNQMSRTSRLSPVLKESGLSDSDKRSRSSEDLLSSSSQMPKPHPSIFPPELVQKLKTNGTSQNGEAGRMSAKFNSQSVSRSDEVIRSKLTPGVWPVPPKKTPQVLLRAKDFNDVKRKPPRPPPPNLHRCS